VLLAVVAVAALAASARAAATPAAASLAASPDESASAQEEFKWPWQKKTTKEKKHSSDCDACDNMKDSKCLALLDAAVDTLSDTDRISFEKAVVDTDHTVEGCPSWTCLNDLDTMAAALSDTDRLSLYTAACADGTLDVSTSAAEELWQWKSWPFWKKAKGAEEKHSSACAACNNKKDSKCLVLLDAAVDSLSDTDRISFEHAVVDVDQSVTGCPSWSCLSQLDEMAAELSDTDRLSMYTDACAQGILVVSETVAEKESETKATATVDTGSEHFASGSSSR